MLNNMALRTKNCRPSPRWSIPAHHAPVYGFVKSYPSRNNPIKSKKRLAFKNWKPLALASSNSLCASLNRLVKMPPLIIVLAARHDPILSRN